MPGAEHPNAYRADFHFVPVPFDLLKQKDLTPAHLATYVGLRSFCDWGKTTGARVLDPTAAARCAVSLATFKRSRQWLREAGWVEWKRTGRANVYTLRSRRRRPKKSDQIAQGERSEGAETADPNAQTGIPPIVDQESGTGESTTPDTVPASARFDAGPYFDVHMDVLKGRMHQKALPILKRLDAEHGPAVVLAAQRRYLEHMRGRGAVEFLNYATLETAFGEWSGPPAATNGRPTRSTPATGGPEPWRA